MSDESGSKDLGIVWREQPTERLAVHLRHFVKRRAQEMNSTTRAEILTSIGAAVFFVAVIWWRVPPAQDRPLQAGFAIVIAWVLFTLYRFRDRIWRRPPIDAVAANGLEYYCSELRTRRDHLRNAWLWHGPLALACMVAIASFSVRSVSGAARLRNAMPIIVFLGIWIVVGFARRRSLANDLQKEIEEMQE